MIAFVNNKHKPSFSLLVEGQNIFLIKNLMNGPPAKTEVFCVCKKPWDDGSFMVQCNQCEEWFHPKCIGVKEESIDRDEEVMWFCPPCLVKIDENGDRFDESKPSTINEQLLDCLDDIENSVATQDDLVNSGKISNSENRENSENSENFELSISFADIKDKSKSFISMVCQIFKISTKVGPQLKGEDRKMKEIEICFYLEFVTNLVLKPVILRMIRMMLFHKL